MKTTIFISLLFLAACSESNEPEPMKCYECTTVTTATGYSDTMKQKACGITKQEADNLEEAGTGTTVAGGVTVRQNTKCRLL